MKRKQQLNGEKKRRFRTRTLMCFWFSYVVFVSDAWRNVGMTISEGGSLETVVFEEGCPKAFPSWWSSISGLYFTCPLNTEIIMKRHGGILCVVTIQ